MPDAPSLARWIEVLPVSEALVREPESAWMASLTLAPPVLDVGCGDGLFASMTFRMPLDVGIDLDERRLRAARRTGAYRFVVRADVRALPFGAGAFGAVVANGSLEHVPGVERGLAQIARIVRAGGRFALTVPGEGYGARPPDGSSPPPGLSWVNRIWGHRNLWPPERWRFPAKAWRIEGVHPYHGPRRYRASVVFFWIGGPWAATCRRLVGRRVLVPAWRRLWGPAAARRFGADTGPGISYGLLLRRV